MTRSAADRQSSITEAVAEFAAHRAVIEQVKGILMVVYSIDADAAFDLLKWRSQETNVKLRTLAEQLLADFRTTLRADKTVPSQATFDQLLLSAHERITALERRLISQPGRFIRLTRAPAPNRTGGGANHYHSPARAPYPKKP